MNDGHESPHRLLAKPWLAEHLAEIEAEISATDALLAAGKVKLMVDLPNYNLLQRYTREALLYLNDVSLKAKALEEVVHLSEILNVTAPRGRGRGRPRKMTREASRTSNTQTSNTKRKGGRPREFSEEFLQWLNKEAEALAAKQRAEGKRASIKAAVTARIEESLLSQGLRIAVLPDCGERFYKPLMKYRASVGKRLHSKSQNLPKNSPDFGPILRLWNARVSPHVQQPPKRGKGKRGDANTSPPARGQGPHRAKP